MTLAKAHCQLGSRRNTCVSLMTLCLMALLPMPTLAQQEVFYALGKDDQSKGTAYTRSTRRYASSGPWMFGESAGHPRSSR
jgi:hypothetical protein